MGCGVGGPARFRLLGLKLQASGLGDQGSGFGV